MAVRIRLKRVGAKNKPAYRIVVADSRSPRDGKCIEELGSYDPKKKGVNFILDLPRAQYWLSHGALPTETTASFIKKAAVAAAAAVPAAETPLLAMQEFLEYVVKGLVRHPDLITITPVDRNGMTIYELRLHPEDVGRVIGKQGVAINALRSLLQAGSAKQGLRCALEIVEDRPPE